MRQPKIFVSMGTPYTERYQNFRDELESILRDNLGTDPRIIGKNEYPTGSPLQKIKEVMLDCDGVLVVAYERKFVEVGQEKRSGQSQTSIVGRTYTTPWNHIESAMAYSLGIPLYVICEKGLSEEGLIEAKLDWYVQYLDFNLDSLRDKNVQNSLRSWVNTIKGRRRRPSTQGIIGNVRLSDMTPTEISFVLGVLIASFALGVKFGNSSLLSVFGIAP